MKASDGGIGHRDILTMPWVTFCAYVDAISEQERKEKDAQHFKNKSLQQEWEENKEDWLKAQPRGKR